MSKSIIGIASNQLASGSQEFDGVSVIYTPEGFITATEIVGGLPIILPLSSINNAKQYINQIDKLLLVGGQDVSPSLFQEDPHPKLGATNPTRDVFEMALIKEALAQNKPIFAVCRGLQILNVALGGNLHQDLSLYPDGTIKHVQAPTLPQFPTHNIMVEEDSILSQIVGLNYQVNSFHHQAIKRLAPSLKATARSSDLVIEAVESKKGSERILGIQWHPELNFTTEEKELALFDYFVNKL